MQLMASVVYLFIFPLNIENVHPKRCIGVDGDYKSASNSVKQITSKSFESPTFSNAASSSINVINNKLLVSAQCNL